MKHTLVVGSGISGLTMALLLATRGRQVTIIEKLPFIGGYINRFTRQGLRFDTGLHFTGGFGDSLTGLLELLNLQDDVKPAPMKTNIMLADCSCNIQFPGKGLDALADTLADVFPKYTDGIHKFYAAEQDVINHTPIFDVKNYTQADFLSQLTDYDAMTVQEFFEQNGLDSPALQALLPIMALCHGTPPVEAPFPYHCRCAYGLDANLSAIRHGGDAFIAGFKREFARYNVNILTDTTISNLQFSDTQPICTAATLSDGQTLEIDGIYFAVHPSAYIPLLPDRLLTPQFKRRNKNLKPTCSFFTIYGTIDDELQAPNRLTFFLQNSDINSILTPGHLTTHSSTGMVTSNDPQNAHTTFTAFRTMFVEDVEKLCEVTRDNYRNNPRYIEFKQQFREIILQDVYDAYPEYKGHLHIIGTASPLTCSRFSPPIGSAYGTRQLLAQSRTAGRLPVENCYALGHHAQFPGILGCMLGALNLAIGQ